MNSEKKNELERNGRNVSEEWMKSTFLNKLWLTKCTANDMWEDGGRDGEIHQ